MDLDGFYIIIFSKKISNLKIKLIFAKNFYQMKKLLLLLSIIFITNSCDDGDITLESFNFSSASISKCSDDDKTFLYKINDNELLLLDITAEPYTYDTSETVFPYTKSYAIDASTISVIYRLYNDTVATTTICSSIAPASPVVTNEWNATGGTIEITTTQRFETDGVTLAGYTYSITLKNINFSNESNSFSFEEYFFGNYQTSL